MAVQIQRRGGTTSQHSTFKGANREITVDTTKKTLVVHDGITAGGHPLAREDLSNVDVSGLLLAKQDMSNVAGDDIASRGIAKSDVSNVSLDDLAGRGLAKNDLSNVSQEQIANKGIAKADLSNTPNSGVVPGTYIAADITVDEKGRIINASNGNIVNQGLAKAWVNFTGSGVVTIKDSYNVSSITDNGVGDYTINFINPFSNSDYVWVGSSEDNGTPDNALSYIGHRSNSIKNPSQLQVINTYPPNAYDAQNINVVIFGNLA